MLLVAKTAQGKEVLVYYSKQEETRRVTLPQQDLFDQYFN